MVSFFPSLNLDPIFKFFCFFSIVILTQYLQYVQYSLFSAQEKVVLMYSLFTVVKTWKFVAGPVVTITCVTVDCFLLCVINTSSRSSPNDKQAENAAAVLVTT
jgi:hypothetical protein